MLEAWSSEFDQTLPSPGAALKPDSAILLGLYIAVEPFEAVSLCWLVPVLTSDCGGVQRSGKRMTLRRGLSGNSRPRRRCVERRGLAFYRGWKLDLMFLRAACIAVSSAFRRLTGCRKQCQGARAGRGLGGRVLSAWARACR